MKIVWEDSDIVSGTEVSIGDEAGRATHVIVKDTSCANSFLLYEKKSEFVFGLPKDPHHPCCGKGMREYLNYIGAIVPTN